MTWYHSQFIMAVFLLAVIVGIARAQVFNAYQKGPHKTQRVTIGSLLTVGLDENLDVWTPLEADTYPVYYFLDGLGGVIPGDAYDQVMTHIASHGIVVVILWKITAPLNPNEKVPLFASVMEWAENHLENQLYKDGVPENVTLDFENLVLGGHSAGSHVQVEYLKTTCGKFKAMTLMSPVDGVDAAGLIPIFCITPGQTLNFDLPTYHLAAGLDGAPGFTGYSCAPDFLSNERFWDALDENSPRWSINATEFGHADFLDPQYLAGVESSEFCSYNKNATDEEFEAYRRFVGGQAVSFIKAVFEDDCSPYLAVIQDTDTMIISATERHIYLEGTCPQPYCTWTPLTETTTAQ